MFGRKKKKQASQEISHDQVKHLFTVLDDLLGNLPQEHIEKFAATPDFQLYEQVMGVLQGKDSSTQSQEPNKGAQQPEKKEPEVVPEQKPEEKTEPQKPTAPKPATDTVETFTTKPEKTVIESPAIEEIIDKKLAEQQSWFEEKLKSSLDGLKSSLEATISEQMENISVSVEEPEEETTEEEPAEEPEVVEEPEEEAPKEEEPEVVEETTKEETPKAEEAPKKEEKKGGLLNLDEIRSRIDKKIEDQKKPLSQKQEEAKPAVKKKTVKKVATKKKVVKKAPPKEEEPAPQVANDADIPDMKKVKEAILSKLKGGK